ncbi:MAG: glycerophosphodiester phosphodiesterase family protein [Oscillospiraceae bacterium]
MAGIFIAIAIILLVIIFLLRPGKYSPEQLRLVYGVNHAHRGLHSKDKSVPENSLAAFRAAAAAGYGVELDIQLSKDGEVVVFHDDTLDRVTGVHGRVDAYTLAELRTFSLEGTGETIPLLTEVFEVMGGHTPIIIELKTGPRKTELCEKGLLLMRAYQGAYCVESFDPRIVAWFRKNAPDILRGQLSNEPKRFDDQPKLLAFALGHLFTTVIARPQFIAYGLGKKPFTVQLAEGMGAMRVCWTARPENDTRLIEETNDAVIFEYYLPEKTYKTL